VNHDLPDEPESYTHRIGRTGRNGADGVAITLCDEGEADKLAAVEKVIRQSFQPDGTLGDYVPRHAPQQAARKPGNRNRRRPRRAA
jgi:ATP-dependent RNA helicase RhlE